MNTDPAKPRHVPRIRIRSGEGRGRAPQSPIEVLLELISAPATTAAIGIPLVLHGHLLAGTVVLILMVIALVQAVIYWPRALRAARQQRPERRPGWHR